MILTALAGNTNTRLTWLERGQARLRRVIATDRLSRTGLSRLLARHRYDAAAVASVVARAGALLTTVLIDPLLVGPRTRTPLRFRYPRGQLGADRLCAAVGAWERFRRDLIVIDCGTAMTFNVVHTPGVFVGGAIAPGPSLMTRSLAGVPARLPLVGAGPSRAIGRNTRTAIRSGISHLLAGGIERMLQQAGRQTGRRYLVVATGGGASVLDRLGCVNAIDRDLAARGLARLLDINRRSHD